MNAPRTQIVQIRNTPGVADLLEHGPCLPIIVKDPDTGAKIKLKALIDTGASASAVEFMAIDKLSPRSIGKASFVMAQGELLETDIYNLVLGFPGGAEVALAVTGISNTAGATDMLIGRDILKFGSLIIDFESGMFLLHLVLPDVILD